jgi:hypothetical protein
MTFTSEMFKKLRTPDSILQPKPGLLDAGGNQPKPLLTQPEQQAPNQTSAITPKAPASTPTAPAQGSSVVPPYQQAMVNQQQQLTPIQAPNTPQYSGYTPESSSTGNAAILNRMPQGHADLWTADQWKQAYGEVQAGNPFIANTVSADGIKQIYDQYISKGITPDFNTIQRTMGGAWTSDFKPSTVGSITLQPGEVQGPNGVSRAGLNVGNSPLSNPLQTGGFNMQNADNKNLTSAITPKGSKPSGASPSMSPSSNISNPAPTPPSITQRSDQGDDSLSKVFQFFKGDLEKERDMNLSEADADAARRGVFYGTPGAQSREDVRDKFGRSLSQLQANLLQNESQNDISRMGLATQLFGNMQANDLGRLQLMTGLIPDDMEASGVDPNLYAAIAQMFGGQGQAGGKKLTAANVPAAVPNISKPPLSTTSQTPQAKTKLPSFK